MDQGARILKKLESHDLEFTRIGRRFDENAQRFDRLLDIVLEHSRKNETLATKDEVNLLRQEMLKHHDEVMVILKRLDQERVFANVRFERLEQKTGLA